MEDKNNPARAYGVLPCDGTAPPCRLSNRCSTKPDMRKDD